MWVKQELEELWGDIQSQWQHREIVTCSAQNRVYEGNKKGDPEVVATGLATIMTFTNFFLISCFDLKTVECSHYSTAYSLFTSRFHPLSLWFMFYHALGFKKYFPLRTLDQYLDVPLGWSWPVVNALLQACHVGSLDPWLISTVTLSLLPLTDTSCPRRNL